MSACWGGASAMVPFTNDRGLRDYRAGVRMTVADGQAPRPRWPWLVLVAFLLGLVLGTRLQAAEPCIALQVRPRVLLQRGDINVQTRIRRHADHRAWTLAWDSDTGSQGSSGPKHLEGEAGPALDALWLRDQPPGHYVFIARIFDAGGRQLGFDRADIRTPDLSQ